MAATIRLRHKPASLAVQVMHAERQVLDRRRLVNVRTALLGHAIRRQMTSPAMLLCAGGLGFLAGQFTRRRASKPGNTRRPSGFYKNVLGRALKLVALVRTLSSLLSQVASRLHRQDVLN